MIAIRNILILLLLPAVIGSCSGLRNFEKIDKAEFVTTRSTVPINSDFSQVLYKAHMEAFGKDFSGILLLKPVIADSSFRVVILSEFGLNLLDMSMNSLGSTVNHCQDFLNRPVIINSIEKNIRMLVFPALTGNDSKKYKNPSSGEFASKQVNGLKRDLLYFNQQGMMIKYNQKNLIGKRNILILNYDEAVLPSVADFENRPVRNRMKLTLLKIEK